MKTSNEPVLDSSENVGCR